MKILVPYKLAVAMYDLRETDKYKRRHRILFIVATVLVIANIWKQTKYSSAGEEISKLWCIHTQNAVVFKNE